MRQQIPSLNGLRALSISFVLLEHLNTANLATGLFKVPFPFTIFCDGSFGVNVFFVISGFLITTLLVEEEYKYGTISLKNFYIRRVFRIFPAYYFVLFVYLILQLCSVLYFTRESWLSSIFYYKYLTTGDRESIHFWSLSVEEHFYLVWPMIFLLFKKTRGYFALGIILLVFTCRTLAYYPSLSYPIFRNWAFIFQRADAIMIGCLIAMYRTRVSEWLNKRLNVKFLPVLLFLLFLNSRYFEQFNEHYHLHVGFLLVPLGIGLSIGTLTNLLIAAVLLFSIDYQNLWFKLLNLPFMTFVGKLSYSLYLWQQLFILSHKLGVLNSFPLNLLCAVTAALFSYFVIEQPFLKLKTRFELGGTK